MQTLHMQSWHDGLPSELPEIVALPERPGMRLRRATLADAEPALLASADSAAFRPPQRGAEVPTR